MTDKIFTAAICVIGNEILSGETQDANIAHIGRKMFTRGIKLREVRIVADDEAEIIAAINALRAKYSYVFTTGGIGPTHDDITVESVARAFGVACPINDEAREYMTVKYAERGVEMNDGRLRMARIPVGAELLHCEATIAPGFRMENVFVMAGVPRIMQAQLESILPTLDGGAPVLSRKVQCNLKEGDIAFELEAIQKNYPDIDVGSYPHMNQVPCLSLVVRGTDDARLLSAADSIAAMIEKFGDQPIR
jgi:molybdenum cofactor synthesis domain-containing protein